VTDPQRRAAARRSLIAAWETVARAYPELDAADRADAAIELKGRMERETADD